VALLPFPSLRSSKEAASSVSHGKGRSARGRQVPMVSVLRDASWGDMAKARRGQQASVEERLLVALASLRDARSTYSQDGIQGVAEREQMGRRGISGQGRTDRRDGRAPDRDGSPRARFGEADDFELRPQ
jgi:hypothetical protein